MAAAAEAIETIEVRKLHPVIGAEIKGVDLRHPLDAHTLARIKDAWHAHTVLVFRGQDLSEADQRRFASYFGPVASRVKPPAGAKRDNSPEWNEMMVISDRVSPEGKPLGSLGHGEMWFHTDKCYRERPHRATFLYGIEIPSEGGHTKFASLYAAYDNLPDDIKRRLANAMVMQGHEYSVGRRLNLDVDLAEDPANTYEHVWRPGDLLMWDNLACLHARTDWPEGQMRTLRRCTVEGERLW